MFIFATTEPHKIPMTILSRCQQHDFRHIDIESLAVAYGGKICRAPNRWTSPPTSIWLIAREAGGSMRDALSLLDQVIASADGRISYDEILDVLGVIDRKTPVRYRQSGDLDSDVSHGY